MRTLSLRNVSNDKIILLMSYYGWQNKSNFCRLSKLVDTLNDGHLWLAKLNSIPNGDLDLVKLDPRW